MLSPLSLRICCFAVMAPALKEAATQAQQHFKLPPSPASSSHSNPASPLGTTISEKCINCGIIPSTNDITKEKIQFNRNLLLNNLEETGITDTSFRKSACVNLDLDVKDSRLNSVINTMSKSDVNEQSGNMGIQQASANLSALQSHVKQEIDLPNVKDIMDVDTPASSPYSSSLDTNISEVKKFDEIPIKSSCSNGPIQTSLRANKSVMDSVPFLFKRTAAIEKRTERLLHRLHKLQFKQSEKHINEQLLAFVENHRKSLSGVCPVQCNNMPSSTSTSFLQSEDMKNMSTAALVNLVRKLEGKNGPNSVSRPKSNNSALAGLSNINENVVSHSENFLNQENRDRKSESICVHAERNCKLSVEKAKEINRVGGTITSNLKVLDATIDSDATESSSGGESCDELDGYQTEKSQVRVPHIHKRAAWKWAVDRAAVASRWTWLQAQISDLEYRIRKHGDIFKQLRSAKTPVKLGECGGIDDKTRSLKRGESSSDESCNPCSTFDAASRLSASASWNDVRTDNCTDCDPYSSDVISGSPDDDWTCVASRVRPVVQCRKRRLLRTLNIPKYVTSKWPRSAPVPCRCLPQSYCIMCGSRYADSSVAEFSTLEERISSADPGFHSVLSFKQDISLPVRFERLLKGGEWQKVSSKNQPVLKKKSSITTFNNNHARSHSKKLAKSAAAQLLSSAKLRRKLVDKKRTRRSLPPKNGTSLRKKSAAAKMALVALKKHHLMQMGQNHLMTSSSSSSKTGSPIPSPAPSDVGFAGATKNQSANHSSDMARKRRESAYDINNIVIPYSMTASTRIEKLQYKEIITPKWRVLEEFEKKIDPFVPIKVENSVEDCKNNGVISPSPILAVGNENDGDVAETKKSEVEDVSDETVAARHTMCECLEKKRFLGIVNQPAGRSRSRIIRNDSRADSSGTNTPDPLSPQNVDFEQMSTNIMHSDDLVPVSPAINIISAIKLNERRRTSSASGKDVTAAMRSGAVSPEFDEEPPIPPYEPRTFPLTDEQLSEMSEESNQPTTMTSRTVLTRRNVKLSADESLFDLSDFPDAKNPEPEDPNDPEWTVISEDKLAQQHPSLVLKLTKR